jgi:hypothetical protein
MLAQEHLVPIASTAGEYERSSQKQRAGGFHAPPLCNQQASHGLRQISRLTALDGTQIHEGATGF